MCKRSLQIQKKNFQHLLNFYKTTDLLEYKIHPEQKKSYQAMTPEKKLQVALDLYYSAKELKAAGLKRQHPDWSTEKINQKVREIFLYART
jgi:hypothetical protein